MSVNTIAIRFRVWPVLPFWSIQTPPKRPKDESGAALPRLILSEKGRFLTRKELFLTLCDGGDLTPENENEIDREQEKFWLDGVAILGDGIDKIIGNGIDDQRGDEKWPAARAPRQHKQKAEPTADRQRPKLPRLPPFPGLIEQRRSVPEPPHAMACQLAEFRRAFTDETKAILLVIIDVSHLSPFCVFPQLRGVSAGMFAGVAQSVAEMVVAEMEFKPEIAAKESRSPENDLVSNQPRRNQCREKNPSERKRCNPGPRCAAI